MVLSFASSAVAPAKHVAHGWARAKLAQLAADGIVELRDSSLKIPPSMRQFSRLVAMTFDAYSSPSSAAHSRAI